jgi:hypothetical protein
MFELGKYSKTGWGVLDRNLRQTLESYGITQQDWDIIRKHGLVDNDAFILFRWFFESPLIEPSIELLTPFHQLAPNLLYTIPADKGSVKNAV